MRETDEERKIQCERVTTRVPVIAFKHFPPAYPALSLSRPPACPSYPLCVSLRHARARLSLAFQLFISDKLPANNFARGSPRIETAASKARTPRVSLLASMNLSPRLEAAGRLFCRHIVDAWTTTTTTKRVERWSVGGGGSGSGGIPRPFRPLPPPLTTRPNPCRSNLLPLSLSSTPSRLPHRRRCLRSYPRATPRRAVIPLSPRFLLSHPRRAAPRRAATAPRVTLIPRDPFDRHPRGTAR